MINDKVDVTKKYVHGGPSLFFSLASLHEKGDVSAPILHSPSRFYDYGAVVDDPLLRHVYWWCGSLFHAHKPGLGAFHYMSLWLSYNAPHHTDKKYVFMFTHLCASHLAGNRKWATLFSGSFVIHEFYIYQINALLFLISSLTEYSELELRKKSPCKNHNIENNTKKYQKKSSFLIAGIW